MDRHGAIGGDDVTYAGPALCAQGVGEGDNPFVQGRIDLVAEFHRERRIAEGQQSKGLSRWRFLSGGCLPIGHRDLGLTVNGIDTVPGLPSVVKPLVFEHRTVAGAVPVVLSLLDSFGPTA